ncbi:hypothetical protein AB0K09_23310 [Streptomyces sp. NPDC049577]|uniref:hypothetical protein n=1 Tax=Streptomyces sp. NPDC049577 TaxID=3155153 RepID=UPI00342BA9D8
MNGPMWLVLCEPGDRAGQWAYAGLRERGLEPLELVSPQALVHARRSAHRVGVDGASFEIGLADGRTLVSGDVEGALNRLSSAPVERLAFATQADTCYAMAEMSALLLSWLTCIAPVTVNRPSSLGLSGTWRSAAEWNALAARAGLPVSSLSLSSRPVPAPPADPATHTVVVCGEQVFGDVETGDLARACTRLARLADTDLLGIDLRRGGRHRAHFAGASLLPDLRIGGSALIACLHERLTGVPTETEPR